MTLKNIKEKEPMVNEKIDQDDEVRGKRELS